MQQLSAVLWLLSFLFEPDNYVLSVTPSQILASWVPYFMLRTLEPLRLEQRSATMVLSAHSNISNYGGLYAKSGRMERVTFISYIETIIV